MNGQNTYRDAQQRSILLVKQNVNVGFLTQKLTKPIAFSTLKMRTATLAVGQWGFDANRPKPT